MQICKNCRKPIRFIARTNATSVMVNADEVTVYTESGREVKGYTEHICEKDKEECQNVQAMKK